MVRKINDDAGYVHVTGADGVTTILKPGDTVPKALEDLVGEHVTNGKASPKVSTEPVGPGQTPAQIARAKAAQAKADEALSDEEKAAKAKAEQDAADLAAAEKAEADKAAAAGSGS